MAEEADHGAAGADGDTMKPTPDAPMLYDVLDVASWPGKARRAPAGRPPPALFEGTFLEAPESESGLD